MESILEIDESKIKYNLNKIRKHTNNSKIIAVLKANAYGHDATIMAKILEENNINNFAVATLEEAIRLRDANIKGDILIFGMTAFDNLNNLTKYNLIQTIHTYEYYELIKASQFKIRAHINLDTGMSRLGFKVDKTNFNDSLKAINEITSDPNINVEGFYTHLYKADDLDISKNQLLMFDKFKRNLNNNKYIYHVANSLATSNKLALKYDYIRIGMLLLGYEDKPLINLKNISKLKSNIISIKDINKGDTVSYNGTFKLNDNMKLAVVNIGYADGIPLEYSKDGYVYIKNNRCKIIGRITMDYLIVNVTNIDVNIEDEVEIFGDNITIKELLNKIELIPHEFFAGLGMRIKRVKS